MSGRTVFQLALTGLLTAFFTSPGLAQFDPQEETPPEVLPMPREKPARVGKAEYAVVPTSGIVLQVPVVPPPPLCAFDKQWFTFPGTPAICPAVPETCGTPEGIPSLPRNLSEIVGEIVESADGKGYHFEPSSNSRRYYIVRVKTPQSAPTHGMGQNSPIPVLGLTTIRWDESGGGWWVETIRVPQPRKVPTADGSHVENAPAFNSQILSGTDAMKAFALDPAVQAAELERSLSKDPVKVDHSCCAPMQVASSPAPCCAGANKLAGTWVREMEGFRIVGTVSGDELKIYASQNVDGVTLSYTLIADCTLTKEGLVHGVVTGVDAELKVDSNATDPAHTGPGSVYADLEPRMPQLLTSAQSLVDCPFAFRTRMTSAGLMISNLKIAFAGDDLKEALPMICGMYKLSKDGNLPPQKPRKTQIGQSENLAPVVGNNPNAGVGASPGYPSTGVGTLPGTALGQLSPPSTPKPIVVTGATGTVTGIIENNSPPTNYYPSPGYAPPAPPVVRPMLPPTLPTLPQSVECPQKCAPNVFNSNSTTFTLTPGNSTKQERNQVLSFSLNFFGDAIEAADKKCTPSGPLPSVCQVPGPQPQSIPPRPSNVPGPEFGLIVDAFGQMLNAPQSPPVAVTPAHVVAPCPPQAIPGMQSTCLIMPPVAASAPANRTLVGTWVRVVGPTVYTIRITLDHITINATSATEFGDDKVVIECAMLTADYHLMKDGTTAIGLITSFDIRADGDLPESANFGELVEELSKLQKALTDKPFAMSIRQYGDTLVIGNVRLPEVESVETWSPMNVLGGRYSAAGDKPLPKPKVVKAPPPPPVAVNPIGYPTGAIGAPIMLSLPQGNCYPTAIPQCFPGGMGQCFPGGMGMMQFPPNCPYQMVGYPNPGYAAPSWGNVSGCGGLMMPSQCPMPSTLMPLPTPYPAIDCPVIGPPAVDLPLPSKLMPMPQPLPEQSSQSFSSSIPQRIERSK